MNQINEHVINLENIKGFFRRVAPERDQHTFVCYHDKDWTTNERKVFHGTIEQHFAELTRLNMEGYGIFWVPNKTNLTGSEPPGQDDIQAIGCCFVNADASLLPRLRNHEE